MADSQAKKALYAKQIADKKRNEVGFMNINYGVPEQVTWEIIQRVGHSRANVYEELRKLKYPVPPRRRRVKYQVEIKSKET